MLYEILYEITTPT